MRDEYEAIFHQIAQEVERDYLMSGLVDTIYEEYAHDILERFIYLLATNKMMHLVAADILAYPEGQSFRNHKIRLSADGMWSSNENIKAPP